MPDPEGFIAEEPQGFVSDEPSALGKAIRSAASAFSGGVLGPQTTAMQQAVPKVAGVTQDITEGLTSDAGRVLVDALNRSGLDPSARLGTPIGGEVSRIPTTIPGTDISPLRALIGEAANRGVEEKAGQLFNEFRTPEQVSTLALLSTKPAQALMAAQALAQVPQDVESVISAQTPQERGSAGLGGAVNSLIAYGLGHNLLKGDINALPKRSTAEVPVEEPPQTGQEVGARVPGPETPSDAQEAQVQEKVAPPAAVTEGETPAASAVSSAQGGEAVTSPTKPATVEPTVTEPVAQGARQPTPEEREFELLREHWLPNIKPWRRELLDRDVAAGQGTGGIETNFQDSPGARDVIRAKRYYELARRLYGRTEGEEIPPTEVSPKLPQETVVAATHTDPETGITTTGANHPQAREAQGVEPGTRKSREKGDDGFLVQPGDQVVSRKEGEAVAQESGQALPKKGEQIHSDEVKSPVDPTKPLSEVPQEPQFIGLGNALKEGEIPETGAGGEFYAISQKLREERARAGQVDPVEPGEGISPQQAFERGEQLLSQGFDAPKALENFLKTESATPDDVMGIRAYGERLAAKARKIEQESGTDSDQYRAAYKALSDWDKRSKGLATAAHKMMVAHQGQVDLDTGSFTSLQRFYESATDKPFKAPDAKAAEKIAKVNENAQKAVSKVVTEVNNVFQTDPVEPHVLSLAQRITDALEKTAGDALKRIQARRAEGRLFTGIDPVELADYALYGASKIAKGAVEFSKWSAEMTAEIGDYIKDHLKQIWDASNERLDETVERSVPEKERVNVKRTIRKQSALDAEKDALAAASRTVRENAIRIAKLDTKSRVAQTVHERNVVEKQKASEVRALKVAREVERKSTLRVAKEAARVKEEADLNEQQKATDAALESANKVVRDNAVRVAEAENKKRSATQAREKKAAIEERRQAEVALRKSQNEARQAAIKAAKAERANQANPMKRVWKAVRGYLDKGETDQDTIRTKVATDLGMKPEQVYRLLARDERVKRLMDDMWLKQQTARRLKENAKRWVMSLDEPKFKKFLESVPNAMFRAKVFGHMGVAFGTHAPAVGFMPPYWADLARDYGKMWGMGLSKTFYERQIQDLMNRKNFVPANRFGLDNHPERFEEYNPKGKTNAGGRSYTALKFIRQDIFDKIWDNLPKSEQTDEVGWAIANRINHMTGTLSTKAPPKSLQGRMKADVKPPTNAAKALFAPTLLFSRYKFIFGDTIQDLGILTHWDTASPGEKAAVKFDVNTKLWVAGTGLALLTANAGLLEATGSKQKINLFDPTRSDWLKFKAFGLTFSPGNAMLSMARIIPREIMTIAGSKKAREDENAATKAWEFARGQMSPFAGTATDLFFGSDYSGRPLPRKLFGTMEQKAKVPLRQREQGVKPYTWPEYALQQASPIPLQEGLKEVWHNGWGMSDKQINGFLKALEISGIMGTTGARVAEDWETKK